MFQKTKFSAQFYGLVLGLLYLDISQVGWNTNSHLIELLVMFMYVYESTGVYNHSLLISSCVIVWNSLAQDLGYQWIQQLLDMKFLFRMPFHHYTEYLFTPFSSNPHFKVNMSSELIMFNLLMQVFVFNICCKELFQIKNGL